MTPQDQTETPKTTALVTMEAFEKKYPTDKFNQLLPSKTMVENVQLFSRLTVETVQINPDPQQQEVYSLGMTKITDAQGNEQWVDKLSPTKTALDKLWFAMGIESVSEKSGRVDNRDDRDYFEYVVVARITKPDGSKMEVAATKAIDVQAYIEEMFENLSATHQAGNLGEWRKPASGKGSKTFHKFTDDEADRHIAKKTRSREIEMRKHGLQLAETGAKNRLVRQITNLKPWYTAKELKNPFVVVRIDRDVAELAANPKTRAEVFREGSHARGLVFPNEGVQTTPLPHVEDAVFSDVEAEPAAQPAAAERADEDRPGESPEFLRAEFEAQCQEKDILARFRQMEYLIKIRQIKAGDSDQLLILDLSEWERKSDEVQVKNLMWAYDQPKPSGLPF